MPTGLVRVIHSTCVIVSLQGRGRISTQTDVGMHLPAHLHIDTPRRHWGTSVQAGRTEAQGTSVQAGPMGHLLRWVVDVSRRVGGMYSQAYVKGCEISREGVMYRAVRYPGRAT